MFLRESCKVENKRIMFQCLIRTKCLNTTMFCNNWTSFSGQTGVNDSRRFWRTRSLRNEGILGWELGAPCQPWSVFFSSHYTSLITSILWDNNIHIKIHINITINKMMNFTSQSSSTKDDWLSPLDSVFYQHLLSDNRI